MKVKLTNGQLQYLQRYVDDFKTEYYSVARTLPNSFQREIFITNPLLSRERLIQTLKTLKDYELILPTELENYDSSMIRKLYESTLLKLGCNVPAIITALEKSVYICGQITQLDDRISQIKSSSFIRDSIQLTSSQFKAVRNLLQSRVNGQKKSIGQYSNSLSCEDIIQIEKKLLKLSGVDGIIIRFVVSDIVSQNQQRLKQSSIFIFGFSILTDALNSAKSKLSCFLEENAIVSDLIYFNTSIQEEAMKFLYFVHYQQSFEGKYLFGKLGINVSITENPSKSESVLKLSGTLHACRLLKDELLSVFESLVVLPVSLSKSQCYFFESDSGKGFKSIQFECTGSYFWYPQCVLPDYVKDFKLSKSGFFLVGSHSAVSIDQKRVQEKINKIKAEEMIFSNIQDFENALSKLFQKQDNGIEFIRTLKESYDVCIEVENNSHRIIIIGDQNDVNDVLRLLKFSSQDKRRFRETIYMESFSNEFRDLIRQYFRQPAEFLSLFSAQFPDIQFVTFSLQYFSKQFLILAFDQVLLLPIQMKLRFYKQ